MYQAVAAMIAAYNIKKIQIAQIGSLKDCVIFKTVKGSYVLIYPIDNYFWTKKIATKTKALTNAMPSGAKKELWISGRFSELSSKNLVHLKWAINDQALTLLDVGNPY